jgi:tRNA threonylcarbamoyladenosine biosynthesis protein TsaE
MPESRRLDSPQATIAAGENLAATMRELEMNRLIIFLAGDLGAGKTTFARGFLRGWGHAGRVPSPTYTLIEPYTFPGRSIYHIDLYRIADQEELDYLGWSDLEDGLRLIEWPERVPGLTAQADVLVSLAYEGAGRVATLTSLSDRGEAFITHFAVSRTSDQP